MVGLRSLGNWRRGFHRGASNPFQHDFGVNGSNPEQNVQQAWSRSGSRLFGNGTTIYSVSASNAGSQTIGGLGIEVPGDTVAWEPLLHINGGDYGQSIPNGSQVDAKVGTIDGTGDFLREGIAELALYGLPNRTCYYVLLNGSNTPIGGGATLAETDAAASAWNWNYSNSQFRAAGPVEFTNGGTTAWAVEGLQVRVTGQSGPVAYQDFGVSASVAVGGSITFTSITQNITNLL